MSTTRSSLLSQPRKEHGSANPFENADFRGMLTPDQEEAIKNTNLENAKIVKLARRTFSQKIGHDLPEGVGKKF